MYMYTKLLATTIQRLRSFLPLNPVCHDVPDPGDHGRSSWLYQCLQAVQDLKEWQDLSSRRSLSNASGERGDRSTPLPTAT